MLSTQSLFLCSVIDLYNANRKKKNFKNKKKSSAVRRFFFSLVIPVSYQLGHLNLNFFFFSNFSVVCPQLDHLVVYCRRFFEITYLFTYNLTLEKEPHTIHTHAHGSRLGYDYYHIGLSIRSQFENWSRLSATNCFSFPAVRVLFSVWNFYSHQSEHQHTPLTGGAQRLRYLPMRSTSIGGRKSGQGAFTFHAGDRHFFFLIKTIVQNNWGHWVYLYLLSFLSTGKIAIFGNGRGHFLGLTGRYETVHFKDQMKIV